MRFESLFWRRNCQTFSTGFSSGVLGSSAGATHEIALVAELTQQARGSVWKQSFPSTPTRIHSCPISQNAQLLVSHASALGDAALLEHRDRGQQFAERSSEPVETHD